MNARTQCPWQVLLTIGLLLAGACGDGASAIGAAPDLTDATDSSPFLDTAVSDGTPADSTPVDAGPADLADGELDGSSHLDQGTTAPAPNPAAPGPHAVGSRPGSFAVPGHGTFNVTVHYPALANGVKAPADPAQAPYPLVVFGHGDYMSKDTYRWVGEHLSSWGYVAVSYSVPDSTGSDTQQWIDGFIASMTWTHNQSAGGGVLAGMVDTTLTGLVGHSRGASAALLASIMDSRPKVLVALSPPAFYLDKDPLVTLPVQFQVGSKDGMCPPSASQTHYSGVSSLSKQLLVLDGANHVGYFGPGVEYDVATTMIQLGTIKDKAATMPHDKQLKLARKYLTAYLGHYLRGAPGYAPYLFGGLAQQDLQPGVISKNTHVP